MPLVQIEKRTGTIARVKPGETPIIELDLGAHQRVISAELSPHWQEWDRKTVDWSWTVYIEHRHRLTSVLDHADLLTGILADPSVTAREGSLEAASGA